MHKVFSIFLITIMLTSAIASSSLSQNIIYTNQAFAEKGGTEKITICHAPPGNPNNEHTITVSENALGAHLNHGDIIGTCPNELAEEYLELISKLNTIGNNLDQIEITQELINEINIDLYRLQEIVIELQNIGYDGKGTVSNVNGKTIGNVIFFEENSEEELFNTDIPDGTLAIFSAFGLIAEFDGTVSEFSFDDKVTLLSDSLTIVQILTNFDDEEIAETFVLASIGAFHPSTGNTFVIAIFLIQTAIVNCLAHPECGEAVFEVIRTTTSLFYDSIFPIVIIEGSEFNDLNEDGTKSGSDEVGVGGFEYELFLTGASGGFISENPTISDSDGKFSFKLRIPTTITNTAVIQSDREGWESTTGNFVEQQIPTPNSGSIFHVYNDVFGNRQLPQSGTTLDEIWQYREHNRISAFPPNYTFTKLIAGDKPLHITSTVAGAGDAYVFKTFKKSDIENHDIKITWSGTSPVASGVNQWNFIVVDGAYDRTSFEDFPVNVFRVSKGAGNLDILDLQVVNFGPQTDTLSPDWASSQLEDVTIFVRVTDSGVQRSITGTVNSIEIIDVAKWTFTDPVITAEQSGTTNDYGTYTSTCVGCDGSFPPSEITVELVPVGAEDGYFGIAGSSCATGSIVHRTEDATSNAMGPRLWNPSISAVGCYRSWSSWDISSIPDGAQIIDTKFTFHTLLTETVGFPNGPISGTIYSLENNPVITSSSTLRNDIRDGTQYVTNDPIFNEIGAHTVDLGSDADTQLESSLIDDWFGIGLSHTDETTNVFKTMIFSASEDGTGNTPPTLIVTYIP